MHSPELPIERAFCLVFFKKTFFYFLGIITILNTAKKI